MITDTLDGRLVCRIGRRADGTQAGRKYRRVLGWLIVGISFGVAAYNIVKSLIPAVELDELAFTLTGGALVVLMLAIWATMAWKRRGLTGSAA
jgi:high-affinity nickel-transport protein